MELVLPPVLFTLATWAIVRVAVARERGRQQQPLFTGHLPSYPSASRANAKVA